MTTTQPAALVGATGLVGSRILQTLLTHPTISNISTYTRKPLDIAPSARLTSTINEISTAWPHLFKPGPRILFSALATNRRVGGIDNQRAIDLDLNTAIAKAAKEIGVKVYVLISALGASSASWFGYSRVKGELEDAVCAMAFDTVVILRPGMIVGGSREVMTLAEGVLRGVAAGLGKIGLKDFWAQEADVVARAAVNAGLLALDGKAPAGHVWVVDMADIVRLGRKEWREE